MPFDGGGRDLTRFDADAAEDWDTLCKNIRAIVESSPGGVPLGQMERDYYDCTGYRRLPVELYGFGTIEELLAGTGQVAVIPKSVANEGGVKLRLDIRSNQNNDEELVVVALPDERTAHLVKMINEQAKETTATRLGGMVPGSENWNREQRDEEARKRHQRYDRARGNHRDCGGSGDNSFLSRQ